MGQLLTEDKWKEMLFSPFPLGQAGKKVRKVREVSKDPYICIAPKTIFLVLFSFPFLLMQPGGVSLLFCFLSCFF